MAKLKINLLGPFQVLLNGAPVTAFESVKVRALLAYLAAEYGRAHTRESLAALLWPDWPQRSAMSNLRYALADLRKVISDRDAQPPFLLVTRDSLQLNREADLQVDVAEFESAILNHQSTISYLQSTISLYRGPFLDSFSLPDSIPFEEWLLAKREYFSQQALKALNRLAEWCLEQAQYEQAESYAHRQIELEPWREQAHQQLMRAMSLKGERVQALAQFESLRKALQRELKVEPSKDTLQLYQQIRDGKPEIQKEAVIEANQQPSSPVNRSHHNPPRSASRFADRDNKNARVETPLDHVVRSLMVGRQRELNEVTQAWHKAQQGECGILLISGEPGVGKTRLVRELIFQVQMDQSEALVGECYAEGSAPYAAFAQMILNTPDWPSNLSQLVLADLIRLVPGLRVYYPDVPFNPPLEPLAEQQRLYESAFTFFARLADSKPLLLVLEDMHWADGGTLALARSLARRFYQTHTSILLVLTFREGELTGQKGLNDLLTTWNRERLGTSLKLHRLDRQGTQDMLEALFAELVSAEFVDGVYHETEGNPFFIEELCKSLIEGGQVFRENGRWQRRSTASIELPRSIRMAIETRLSGLPEATQEVLHLAAVLGRRFEFDALQAAADPAFGQDEDALISALEAAEQAQLLFEVGREGGGTFEFAHALIPATLNENLSRMRRRRLHHRAWLALEKLHPEDYKTLAHHCLEAGEDRGALKYLLKAARHARETYANAEAVDNYQQALSLLNDFHGEAAQEAGLQDIALHLHEDLGDMLELTGQHEQAWTAYQNALSLVPASEGIRRSGLFRKAARTRENLRLYDEADRVYHQAEEALGPEPVIVTDEWRQEWLALQLDRIQLYYWPGRVQEMLALVDQVRQAVERYGSPVQRGKFYNNIALAMVRRDRYVVSDEVLALNRQALSILKEVGVGSDYVFAEFALGFTLLWHGDLEEAEKQLQISLQIGEHMGDVTIKTRALTYLAIVFRKRGDVANVLDYSARSLEAAAIGQMIEYTSMAQANQAWAARREGKLGEARRLAEDAWRTMQKTPQSQMFTWVQAWPLLGISLDQNRVGEAVDYARTLLDPKTQPQPKVIAAYLQSAVQAWEQGQEQQAVTELSQASKLAEPLGYI